jgi:ABC-type multidrug transport system fused ATPase/permease subunit
MRILIKYRIVFAIVIPVLILVLIRSFGVNHFKADVKKWAESSVEESNIISKEQIENLTGEKLIINLDKEKISINNFTGRELFIPADSVLDKRNLQMIRKHSGSVLLFSSDPSVSARVWMILSQMGCTKIYILIMDKDNEVPKNKFRPDTLVRPESYVL